jgi:proteasome accessory factor B
MASPTGRARKTERLLQVVLCLTQTRRYVTKDQLRQVIPDYEACPTTEAFERMFERDKNELRELGIPLETGPAGSAGTLDDDPGYRIDRDTYALPPLRLTRDELTAVGLAARVWRDRGPATAAARALLKLQADTPSDDDAGLPAIEPRLSGGESAFAPLTVAVAERRPVRFGYQGPRDPEPRERHVQPWGVVSRRGRWYVVGHDTDRGDERVFRLSRIVGEVTTDGPGEAYEVPPDVDLRSRVDVFADARPTSTAVLRVRAGSGHGLRRRATAVHPAGPTDPGSDVVTVDYGDTQALAEEISGYGAAVRVDEPPELRAAVVARLRAVLVADAAGEGA